MAMRILPSVALAVVLAAVLAACAGPDGLPPIEGTADESYRLDTGDQLRVVVFNQEQLSGDYTVGGDGSISMPLVGAVQARGLTTSELEASLVQWLSEEKDILVNPSVNVQVQAFRPFYILGEVRSPGQYPSVHQRTVLSAVALAGGFTYRARTDYVSITRETSGQAVERRADRDTIVQPGDVIYVYERYF
jgi:polysaccharide export outer membrane protein